MKRLFTVVLLVALLCFSTVLQSGQSTVPARTGAIAASGAATWSVANGPTLPAGGNGSAWDCNTTCVPYSLGYTLAIGDVLVICAGLGANAYILSGDTAYGTWVSAATVPNLKVYQSSATNAQSCTYVIATATTTSVTMGYNVDAAGYAHVYDLHKSSGTIVAETVPTPTTSTSCGSTGTHCIGPAVTITGSNDVIIAMAGFGNDACTVASPFLNIQIDGFSDASAQQLNTTTGTGSSWTQGTACPTAAAAQFGGIALAFK